MLARTAPVGLRCCTCLARPPSTVASSRLASTSSRRPSAALPRAVPTFPATYLLSDGSSITLNSTSPKTFVKLTRDTTNHPLWNPSMARSRGESDDESGRLGRFARRFGAGGDGSRSPASAPAPGTGAEEAVQDGGFTEDDFAWMTGGTEVTASKQPVGAKKGKK